MLPDVISISSWRAIRTARQRVEAARQQAMSYHPSLRWCAGDCYYTAHARKGDRAACGADGALVLAPPGVPLCDECFPPALRIVR